ncbi:inositol monophosphatase [Nakamurella antarctica]|uniref:Inositol-1-monophosphatase n=1 Tax=Nakamurella antarctica TaxID=1902245 RepID=A0A3G8ZX79_9ACTN|nr:inositol monophosphatase family protein [Nakamurella antarctica]AZI59034.1 inositol monophosphatase [Nakamurella antarctica]
MSPDPVALSESLLDLAMRAARAAGAELLSRYGTVSGLDAKSSATDPVSDADRAAEDLLVAMISGERPRDGFVGEEGAAVLSLSGITWVLDPLDGTVNYLYQLDNFSVSVAAEDAQGAVVGVVYDPVRNLMFSACRGGGAYRNGLQIHCAPAVPAALALVSTGFGYSAPRRAAQGAVIARVLPLVRDIRRIGSAALDLCGVAAGATNAYFEEGVQRWDIAAGGLIAAEAGATVTTFTPTGVATGVLAAAPALHDELRSLVMTAAELAGVRD